MEENNTPPELEKKVPVMDIQPPKQQVQQTVTEDQEPVEAPATQDEPQQNDSSSDVQAESPVLMAQPTKEKSHRTPILAIVSAVIIAGVFAGVAFLAYSSKSSNEQPKTATTTTEQPKVTSSDVEEASKAIDDSTASLDEAADYNESEINDTTLGL